MRGIVIAGGLGTRLRPLTLTRPKPLMPLVNAPLLEYQLFFLKTAGIEEVCFATNYMAEAVEEYFGGGSRYGMKLVYATESEPLDTGGAIRNAYEALPRGDCVVFNGDVIHGFDIAAIIARHKERGAEATITLKEVACPHAYGVVPLDPHGRVQAFLEPTDEQKRCLDEPPTGETDAINTGLYVLSADVIEAIPLRRCSVEREVFPSLVAEGRAVYGDVQTSFWIDIGRPSQYLAAVRAVLDGLVPSPRPVRRCGQAAVDETAQFDESVQLLCGSCVGPGVRIGKDAVVSGSALLEGVEIGEGARVENSIVGEGSKIGAYAVVKDAALGGGCVVGDYSVA